MTPGWTSLTALALFGLLAVPAGAETIQITVDKMIYTPAEVSAKVGDTIEWVNKDILAHTSTATNGNFNVVTAPKMTGRAVVKTAGIFDYFCKYHPNMKARVTVAP